LAKESETPITFKDVAGIDYALEELQEIVNFLKHPEKYRDLGAKPPKGVLLEGNPGVGKTLLAQAIAGEAGVPFYSCNGSEFVEMFVGVGASRVRDLFERAKSRAPCIIFIDELDAIGRQRGGGGQLGNGEAENTLNQLLGEMDGFGQDAGIIIIAATNRADVLDKALLRPGRFDKQLRINPPDKKGRLHILNVHARGRKLAKSVDLKKVARRTLGMTGADLNNLLNEALMRAGKLGKSEATMEHIDWAYERIVAGASRPDMIVSPDKKKLVAYHEAGHALVGALLGQEVASVSIVPRDRAAGLTWFTPTERSAEDGIETRKDLENRMVVALGGRVAEELIYKSEGVTTGAGSDLQKVSQIAYAMVDSCGFGRGMAPRATLMGGDTGRFNGPQVSEKELAKRSDAVDALASEAEREAKRLIQDNKIALHAIANALLVAENITGDQLDAIIKGRKWDEVVASEDGDDLDLEDEALVPAADIGTDEVAA
jgi:cell division protease FtsH